MPAVAPRQDDTRFALMHVIPEPYWQRPGTVLDSHASDCHCEVFIVLLELFDVRLQEVRLVECDFAPAAAVNAGIYVNVTSPDAVHAVADSVVDAVLLLRIQCHRLARGQDVVADTELAPLRP